MVIAQRLGTVRKRYKKRVHNRGVNHKMLTKYMRNLTQQDCPIVISITETPAESKDTVAIRNNTRDTARQEDTNIYMRAREIYFRARRHRPVRAASIF